MALNEKIKKENFVLMEIRYGPMTKTEIAPVVKEKPRGAEELEKMLAEGAVSREGFERIVEAREALGEELQEVLKWMAAMRRCAFLRTLKT